MPTAYVMRADGPALCGQQNPGCRPQVGSKAGWAVAQAPGQSECHRPWHLPPPQDCSIHACPWAPGLTPHCSGGKVGKQGVTRGPSLEWEAGIWMGFPQPLTSLLHR